MSVSTYYVLDKDDVRTILAGKDLKLACSPSAQVGQIIGCYEDCEIIDAYSLDSPHFLMYYPASWHESMSQNSDIAIHHHQLLMKVSQVDRLRFMAMMARKLRLSHVLDEMLALNTLAEQLEFMSKVGCDPAGLKFHARDCKPILSRFSMEVVAVETTAWESFVSLRLISPSWMGTDIAVALTTCGGR